MFPARKMVEICFELFCGALLVHMVPVQLWQAWRVNLTMSRSVSTLAIAKKEEKKIPFSILDDFYMIVHPL